MSGVRLEANVISSPQVNRQFLILFVYQRAAWKSLSGFGSSCSDAFGFKFADKRTSVFVWPILAAEQRNRYILTAAWLTSMIPIGGSHFIQDAAVGLRTPRLRLKHWRKNMAARSRVFVGEEETIEVEGVGGRKARSVERKELARARSTFMKSVWILIANNIRVSGLQPLLGSGIVITGGAGSDLMNCVRNGRVCLISPFAAGYQ